MTLAGDALFDYARTVKSRSEFVRFVEFLNTDLRENRDEWENNNLESFLSGLSGFANDMDGFYRNMGEIVDIEQLSWRMAAQMLLAARVYGN
jgi:hypothetical protein